MKQAVNFTLDQSPFDHPCQYTSARYSKVSNFSHLSSPGRCCAEEIGVRSKSNDFG